MPPPPCHVDEGSDAHTAESLSLYIPIGIQYACRVKRERERQNKTAAMRAVQCMRRVAWNAGTLPRVRLEYTRSL